MVIFCFLTVFQALYAQEKEGGRRDLVCQSVWLRVSLVFCLPHRGLVFVTPMFWDREKRGFGQCQHTELPQCQDRSPSWTNHATAPAQVKSLAIEARDKSILEKRYFAQITWIFTFQKKEMPCFPSQICWQMLLWKQMFSPHSILPKFPSLLCTYQQHKMYPWFLFC